MHLFCVPGVNPQVATVEAFRRTSLPSCPTSCEFAREVHTVGAPPAPIMQIILFHNLKLTTTECKFDARHRSTEKIGPKTARPKQKVDIRATVLSRFQVKMDISSKSLITIKSFALGIVFGKLDMSFAVQGFFSFIQINVQ